MCLLSIVIPAYNEEQGIARIIDRVHEVRGSLAEAGFEMELLVVNDGSRDRTSEIACEKEHDISELRVISHPVNRGYGAALKTGFAHARGELICFLDADGTYPPEYLPQLALMANNGADLVIGSRMAGAESHMPVTRRLGNIFFASLLSVVGFGRVTDSASGMRVFKRDVLQKIYPLPDGLNFTPVMSTRAVHEGVRVAEFPIPYEERIGASKLSVVRDGSVFLRSILWTVLSYNPVRLLGFLGLGSLAVTLAVLLGLVIARLSGVQTIGPWGAAALFAALTSAVGGVSLFGLGATFNYLVSLFYKRPIRQGLFGKPLFKTPLDRQFGWLGIGIFLAGLAVGVASVILGLNGWPITRLWLYLLGGAMLILVGFQFIVYWILMRVLEELSHRDAEIQQDLQVVVGAYSN